MSIIGTALLVAHARNVDDDYGITVD